MINLPELLIAIKERVKELGAKKSVAPREFVEVCLMAVQYIEGGPTTEDDRNDIAYGIAELGFRCDECRRHSSPLDGIWYMFKEFEIPAYFNFEQPQVRDYWQATKEMIDEADKLYPPSVAA